MVYEERRKRKKLQIFDLLNFKSGLVVGGICLYKLTALYDRIFNRVYITDFYLNILNITPIK